MIRCETCYGWVGYCDGGGPAERDLPRISVIDRTLGRKLETVKAEKSQRVVAGRRGDKSRSDATGCVDSADRDWADQAALPHRWSRLVPVDSTHRGEGEFEGMRAVAGVPLSGDGQIELVGEREARQRQAQSSGFIEGNSHVFDEVLDEEAGVEVARDDSRAEIR